MRSVAPSTDRPEVLPEKAVHNGLWTWHCSLRRKPAATEARFELLLQAGATHRLTIQQLLNLLSQLGQLLALEVLLRALEHIDRPAERSLVINRHRTRAGMFK